MQTWCHLCIHGDRHYGETLLRWTCLNEECSKARCFKTPRSGAVRQVTDPEVVPALSLRTNAAQAAPIQPLLLPWSLRPDLEELGGRKSTFSPSVTGQRKGFYQKPLKSPGFVTPSPHVPVPTVTNEPILSAPTQGSPEPCLVSGASLPC